MNVTGPTDPLYVDPSTYSLNTILGNDNLNAWINNLSNVSGGVFYDIIQKAQATGGDLSGSLKNDIAAFLSAAILYSRAQIPIERAISAAQMAVALLNIKSVLSESDVTNLVTLANDMITEPPFNATAFNTATASTLVYSFYQRAVGSLP